MDALFRSFFGGGFECSSHRRADGHRVDCITETAHDRFAHQDYEALASHGLLTARDGLRWHLIETAPGRYDWSSAIPLISAAKRNGVRVFWDLCHYGYPDDLEIWTPEFVDRFARYAAAAATLIQEESGEEPLLCAINELSYWAWAGGEMGIMNPAAHQKGDDLKRQLVRATIAAIKAVRAVTPRARFLQAEPVINVVSRTPPERALADMLRDSQFQALDMLAGNAVPELGGSPDLLDMVGVNFYSDNQWFVDGATIPIGSHAFRPLRHLLAEVHARYGRPMMISETGAEGGGRAAWLHYVCTEVAAAVADGVPIGAICIYPILDYPSWTGDRWCEVGLFAQADTAGSRAVYPEFASALRDGQARLAEHLGRGGSDAASLQPMQPVARVA